MQSGFKSKLCNINPKLSGPNSTCIQIIQFLIIVQKIMSIVIDWWKIFRINFRKKQHCIQNQEEMKFATDHTTFSYH